jgi:hypothetical protein
VYIFNRGEQTVTYRVELIDGAMLPTGEIIALRIWEFWVIPNAHMGYKKDEMSFFCVFLSTLRAQWVPTLRYLSVWTFAYSVRLSVYELY